MRMLPLEAQCLRSRLVTSLTRWKPSVFHVPTCSRGDGVIIRTVSSFRYSDSHEIDEDGDMGWDLMTRPPWHARARRQRVWVVRAHGVVERGDADVHGLVPKRAHVVDIHVPARLWAHITRPNRVLLAARVRGAGSIVARAVGNQRAIPLSSGVGAQRLRERRVAQPLPDLFAPDHLVEVVGAEDHAEVGPVPRVEVCRITHM
jgi:hypothetical protein